MCKMRKIIGEPRVHNPNNINIPQELACVLRLNIIQIDKTLIKNILQWLLPKWKFSFFHFSVDIEWKLFFAFN